MNLKEALKKKLSVKELSILPRAFEIIGHIAVISLPQELRKKKKIIAQELLKLKNIKTVVNKTGRVRGKLRKATYKIIAGEKNLETVHKENNCRMKLDITKTYFSARLAADRLDIARKAKKGEKILVMFAGILPYALVIAKNSKAKEILAVEINKQAGKYAQENIRLNKLRNVEFILGDVKKVAGKLKKQRKVFDRIIMPRPQLKETFLKEAFLVAKKGTIIHYHDFLKQEEIKEAEQTIKQGAATARRKIKIIRRKKIGELSPSKSRIRFDFKIC